ncbi:hypothetical protein HYN43_014205 [Mucilaginibacter celer]|uniref:Uncharacterized protein n=1 Tax=Mucilaginibacter celer TaxID=2305508 RepID=A0A494VM53_9SPHI|nr:hypothetical protein HYN43_014205 [Mucilaginibacter celer]
MKNLNYEVITGIRDLSFKKGFFFNPYYWRNNKLCFNPFSIHTNLKAYLQLYCLNNSNIMKPENQKLLVDILLTVSFVLIIALAIIMVYQPDISIN